MDTESDATPSRVGRYDVVLPLATGQTATVYLARPCDGAGAGGDASEEHYFALKLVARGIVRDPATRRILALARSRRHLRHANVITVVDVGDAGSGAFVLMDYVPGDTLAGLWQLARARSSGASLPRAVAIRILVDALTGLHAVHELPSEIGQPLELVHRGLSARKILVGTDGIARLADFASSASEAIVTGGAPELMTGGAVDRRADVWSAGAVLWEILTGRPFEGGELPSPKVIAPDVTSALDVLVTRALAPDPASRPPTALAFARDLEAAARSAAMFTDTRVVAEHVGRLVGPDLAERRALLHEARKDLQKRRAAPPDVRTMIGVPGPLPLKRAPLPSLPDVPPSPTSHASELRIEVNLARPVERATLDVLGAGAPGPPPPDEPEVFRSPLLVDEPAPAGPQTPPGPRVEANPNAGPPRAPPPPAGSTEPLGPQPSLAMQPTVPDDLPAGVPVPARATPLALVRDVVGPWVTPPWTTKKISTLAGIGGGLIGFVLVLIAVSGSAKPSAKTARAGGTASAGSASASAAASVAAVPPPLLPLDERPPPNPTASAASLRTDVTSGVLEIKANGPVKSVSLDGRYVDAVVPTPTITVDRTDAERSRALRVVVTGVDGRTASATAPPGATAIDLTFSDRPRAVKPSPAPTTKHPWSKKR